MTEKRRYYSPEGQSMEQDFLRTPVDFTRISSGFSSNRKHPIFGDRRPHRAIDYAAPMNTPIKVTGKGIILFIGYQKGYGKVIYVKHKSNIVTVYAHLNRFSRHLKRSNRVQKGDIIGYVGMTGYATGPHLHYEFRVNGVHKNPLKVKLPHGRPIIDSRLAAFKHHARPLLAKLSALSGKVLVMGKHNKKENTEI